MSYHQVVWCNLTESKRLKGKVMGQYHTFYSKTKKEFYSMGGAKLWEKAYSVVSNMAFMVLLCNSNNRGGGDLNNPIFKDDREWDSKKSKHVKRDKPKYESHYEGVKATKTNYDKIEKALGAIQGRWVGDEIIIQGDYAEQADYAFISEYALKRYKDISKIVFDSMRTILIASDGRELFEKEFKYELQRGA